MIRPFRFLSREVRGMHQAAYILAGFSLGSQLLALVRDRLLAAAFGAGHTLDLYNASYQIPNFLFATIASLFSLYALLPILTRLEDEREGATVPFLRDILWVFFVCMGVVAMIAYILAPVILPFLAPGLVHNPASYHDLLVLTRILLLQPILLGASNTIAALTQLRHRFVLYSLSPLFYNLGIIFGAVVLYPHWGIVGLGWGVVSGAFMHMAVQMPFFFSEKPTIKISFTKVIKGVQEVLVLSLPRTLSLASTQISFTAITAIASVLATGSIAVFTFAYNLQAVPLTIIGVSYSVAAFPTLARLHAQGAKEQFLQYIEAAMRHIVFWSIPAMVFVIVLRAQLVRVILGAGQFDWNSTRLTAAALALFIVSLSAQSLTLLIARTYYATGNTRKPLYYGCVDIVVSVSSALLLLFLFKYNMFARSFVESILRVDDLSGTSVLMLALGYALGSIAEFIVGYLYFVRDFAVSVTRLKRLVFESFSASIIGAAATYIILSATGVAGQINTTIGLIVQGIAAGITGLAIAAIILWLLKNQELAEAITAFKRNFLDVPQVAVEPSDVS